MTQSDREKAKAACELTRHSWIEEYYGYRCEQCGEFIPYGCEPWAPLDDDLFNDGEPDFTLDDLEWSERYE